MKSICVITATRAEYGLLKPLMDLVNQSKSFHLQVLVTGAHLSPEFGLTYKTIEKDGFRIDAKVEMLLSSDTPSGIVKSMGVGMIGFADAFQKLRPDALVILGDRYEILSAASAASVFKIPIIHLHGGEITEGAYDDAFRHAITKLSHIHFTSTDTHRERVIQLGEDPQYVHNVGAIGLDNIKNLQLKTQNELENELGFKFGKFNYLVTYHPETLSGTSSADEFKILLEAIEKEEDSLFIFTKANADTDGRIINAMIDEFVLKNPERSKWFTSLGSLRFLSLLRLCDAIVGNSSSGIIEAPSLNVATINIGDRQKGRTQASSVVNCKLNYTEIKNAFLKVKEKVFNNLVKQTENPYGDGNTAERIINILERVNWNNITTKRFHHL